MCPYRPLRMKSLALTWETKARTDFRKNKVRNVPGGVHASAGDCTNVDRLLVGMGKAIFCSLCFARAA